MIRGDQYTITSSAVKLTTALNLGDPLELRGLDISAKASNAATFYIGGANVTNTPAHAWGEITPTKAWSMPVTVANSLSTDDVYIVGTDNDIAYIVLMV